MIEDIKKLERCIQGGSGPVLGEGEESESHNFRSDGSGLNIQDDQRTGRM